MKVFISYAREDLEIAKRLRDDLEKAGIKTWLDKEDLLPGQNWRDVILREIRESRYFIAMLSSKALSREGFVHKELKTALDFIDHLPADRIFIIPVRTDECMPADEKLKYIHWADLFPSYEDGLKKILRVLTHKNGLAAPVVADIPETETVELPPKPVVKKSETYAAQIGMKFVPIPAGSFMMGSPPNEPGRYDDETQHKVTISKPFYMQTTQVTQKQWQAIMGNNPSYFRNAGEDCPVEQVSWDDVQEFIKKLNQKEGTNKYRLPTEAEWEYAARAGTETAIYTGNMKIIGENNAPDLDPIAWYGGNSGVDYEGGYDSSDWKEKQYDHKIAGTHPVGKKKPNAFGLYDILGNVWEWCQDWYDKDYLSGAVTDPTGPSMGRWHRVIRGGGWNRHAKYCRSASRIISPSDNRAGNLGFRLVRLP